MFGSLQVNVQLLLMIVALLAAGAVAIAVAGVLPRRRDVSELWRLFGTEFAIVGAVAVAALDTRVLLIALLAFGARGQFELRDLFGVTLPRWFVVVDLAVAGIAIAGAWFWDRLWEGAALAAVVAMLGAGLFSVGGQSGRAAAVASAGSAFPVPAVAAIGLLGALPDGLAWLLFVFIVVETNDSFALLCGKLFGRRRILPKLSPGKTVEGAVGGIVCGAVVGMLLATMAFGLPVAKAIASVAVVLVVGIAGDLLTSALKRFAGRKDFAAVHVLHGGVLDIYDSVVVAAPFFYAYHRLFLG